MLIVGAGPTGLTLACELRRHSVGCRIVDRAVEPADRSRAADIQSRTLWVFQDMGVLRPVLDRGHRLEGMRIYEGPTELARLAYEAEGAPFPFVVGLPQTETEDILRTHLSRLDGEVEAGTTLNGFETRDDGVVATLTAPDGAELTVEARYLVGCDGASSTVREGANIDFGKKPGADTFLVADARVDWALPDTDLALFLSEAGFVLGIPQPGEHRIRLVTDYEARSSPPADLAAFAARVSERVGGPVVLHGPGFVAPYRVHRRIAAQFHLGRVLIAGDAAHTYSPVGGQGMNQGIQDAYNLGWKLALVLRGHAHAGLLDTYATERRAVARSLGREMDFGARLALSRLEVPPDRRERLMRFAARCPPLRRSVLDSALEQACSYPQGRMVREVVTDPWALGPSAGASAPDLELADGTRLSQRLRGIGHTLLVFPGRPATGESERQAREVFEIADRYGELVRILAVDLADVPGATLPDPDGSLHERYGAQGSAVYLIRPDGHIAFRALPIKSDALAEHLERMLLPP